MITSHVPLDGNQADVALLQAQRDLYFCLLNLGLKDDLEPFLDEALALVTRAVGAHQAYLELAPPGDDGRAQRWCSQHGFSREEVGQVRLSLSRGIISAALQSGETVVTRSACHDARFGSRESVHRGRIEAVLCAPIGQRPPIGAIYLQRRFEPGPFSEDDRARVEIFARHLAPYADRLVAKRLAAKRCDPTGPFRERMRLDGVVGSSAALAEVVREISLVAPLDVDVFLTGQSGTGKSQFARVIHDNSPRAGRPFVELNCAAIPESLIESELFGALPGAHSTASRRIDGKLSAANGGTLLLDEIGELSIAAQAKLLQLMQSRIYYPLGSAKPVRVDVRIIAATNIDLETSVKAGRFREDLYYRLAVLPIRLPALAERRDDIPDLARHFCALACSRHRLPRLELSPQLLDALAASEWPGNIRQLAHAVEAAAIRAGGAGLLQVEKSHVFLSSEPTRSGDPHEPRAERNGRRLTFQEATRRFQAQLLREALEETAWNVNETARRLEINRSHVYALIRGFGIERRR
ncbi:MAG TPA: sigma-54-dependent Fis family transcriptional regulator [Candidatus Binatia bacterium]|nr:sigma-54-dependent Fis family transcriptional regulator [Candidatus Binatia bacterium]